VPQSGNGGQPGGHGHDPAPFSGTASGDFLQLAGHGVTVRSSPSHLEVTWESGAQMTMRSPERWTTAHVDHLRLAGVVTLTLNAHIPVPDPGFSQVEIVLAFPGSLEEDVRRLAARLNADREGSGSPATGRPDPAPPIPPAPRRHDPWDPETAEPVRARAHDRPPPPPAPARTGYPAELPAVAFEVDLGAWADDPDWIGLFPSFETARLIVDRPFRQSHQAGSPPSG
jgi:hypothetical protein